MRKLSLYIAYFMLSVVGIAVFASTVIETDDPGPMALVSTEIAITNNTDSDMLITIESKDASYMYSVYYKHEIEVPSKPYSFVVPAHSTDSNALYKVAPFQIVKPDARMFKFTVENEETKVKNEYNPYFNENGTLVFEAIPQDTLNVNIVENKPVRDKVQATAFYGTTEVYINK